MTKQVTRSTSVKYNSVWLNAVQCSHTSLTDETSFSLTQFLVTRKAAFVIHACAMCVGAIAEHGQALAHKNQFVAPYHLHQSSGVVGNHLKWRVAQ